MLNENLKKLRKQSGLTQEAFAIRLNVVRQTVSKWEKGLSVPDAQTLQRIAEEFEIPVQELLGSQPNAEENQNGITDQLARINEQLAIRNRRSANIWKILCLVLILLVGFLIGKAFSNNSHLEEPEKNLLLEKTEISNVHFNGNGKELVCYFVPSVGNDDMVYTVTMHSHDIGFSDETVTAQYDNGICTAVFDKAKLSEFAEYTVVLNIACEDDIRNLTLAENFNYRENSYSWQMPE
ncbi:MAG: helix-turn-helix domain-containing protein [Acutalibacteraceae bacterium]